MLQQPDKTPDELKQDNEWRSLHAVPPGCSKEDVSKPDKGIGDKIIWHTILKIASQRNVDAIFVTQDVTKGDWVHHHGEKNKETVLFPLFELAEEFRRVTNGRTLHIIELSTLLELEGAAKEAVDAVRERESASEEAESQAGGAGEFATSTRIGESPLQQARLQLLAELSARMPLEEAMREVDRRIRGESPASQALRDARIQRQMMDEEQKRRQIKFL